MTATWRNSNKGRTYEEVIEKLQDRIVALEKIILVMEPESKYPALAEAYREYKIIERLTIGNDKEA